MAGGNQPPPESTADYVSTSPRRVSVGLTQEELSKADAQLSMTRILPEDANDLEIRLQHSARKLSDLHAEFRIRHGDGSIRWIENRSTPRNETDGSIVWTGILLDVTQRKKAEELIQAMAITDGLTGIINHREFTRLLKHEIGRAARYDTPLSLVMYDLDHFKQINDRFGHDAGDDVLKTVTRLVNDNIRSTDIQARRGGEEFMILLPQTRLDAAREVAKKSRQVVADHRFNQIGTVTASFGVVELASQENARSLLKRVDEALYRAKSRGRNRVEV